MENIIIVGILVIAIGVGIRSTVKHFRGESECCGGGSKPVKVKKKKLQKVIAQKTAIVEGMTCDHCKARVERCINDIDGVAGVVNLKKKEVVISFEKEVDDSIWKAAIEETGYTVVSMH